MQWGWLVLALGIGGDVLAGEVDPAIERGRVALTQRGYLSPAWTAEAYSKAGLLWGTKAHDADKEPETYATAFRRRYGLHPAPYSNDGLPKGVRRAPSSGTGRAGLQIDCLVCHAGSIGGTSLVGLGNS